jgi:NAD(P)-dependent dehydrogenase (short-subunit alcohol dehydrogenase family)
VELEPGKVAVVTGAASGIGAALADRFARAGLHVVLADVDEEGLTRTAEQVGTRGVESLSVLTDVSDEAQVQALAAATVERFEAVHLVCNNAGVVSEADPWLGPISAWQWVMGVNFWGVVHGMRAFLPFVVMSGGGHIVNTASMAGLSPGFSPSYDASKHAVVAITEDLFNAMTVAEMPIGVSVLCPGWVRTGIVEADRNWPDDLGARPELAPTALTMHAHVERAIAEGTTPAAIADEVADAVVENRFWVIPHDDFLAVAVERWERIAQRIDPESPEQVPGLPPFSQLVDEMRAAMEAGT